jgi:hypothetical protein
MNAGQTVFSQLVDHLPSYEFQKCVERYRGDAHHRGFSCRDQYLAMAFAQLTYRESLRDIEACLGAMRGKLYHMGFRGRVTRSTLGDANEAHDWRIFADFAQLLIAIARPLYADDPLGVDLVQALYALDSTTIDLCLSVFPWARFRRRKGAVKMHTLLDLRGNIPTFIRITDGKVHDVNILDELVIEAGAFYVWIVATSILSGFMHSRSRWPSSLCVPKRTYFCSAATRIRWTRALACAQTRLSSWQPSDRHRHIRMRYAA